MVGPVNRSLVPAASVPSRASLARRFLATLTVAPAVAILPRRSLTWLTVRPLLWATTTTLVVENTWWRIVTSSFFSALSTCSLLQWRRHDKMAGAGGPTAKPNLLEAGEA